MSKEIIVSVPLIDANLAIANDLVRYFIEYIKNYVGTDEYNIRADSYRMQIELKTNPPIILPIENLTEREVIVINVPDEIYRQLGNLSMVLGLEGIQGAFNEISNFCIQNQIK